MANQVLAFSNAIYSVISPEGCAAILWRDSGAAPLAARALRLDARSLLEGLGDGDAVLIKASRAAGLEVLADRLSGSGEW